MSNQSILFPIPEEVIERNTRFNSFLDTHLISNLPGWYQDGAIPRTFFETLGREGWLGFDRLTGRWIQKPTLELAVLIETLARTAPGVAVAMLAQTSLGMQALWMFGSEDHKQRYWEKAARGETLLCLGNTELDAGSDVASIRTRAERRAGQGWRLFGGKAYVTNGSISDLTILTAVSDPTAERSRRISMYLVDLTSEGVIRKKLNKRVWIPSDLTRVQLNDVVVPEENLMGTQGKGLQQVLSVFTQSRLPISALTTGTAVGAFELGLEHMRKRKLFGKPISEFQAKTFEMADLYSRLEAARLMVWNACRTKDAGRPIRIHSSMAKYLAVQIAREVSSWAADLFGAASVVFEHPIHKFPMDAWASSLGEGTQDIQKLIIAREVLNRASGMVQNEE
ncbi:MAG: acyl-CoA dehydrogenase family protein [Deltaproteobacteria bacterium]|nr:acyl-CoA dehydrogenase family protein [Deltaproteobacteria bacterium]